jgi:hypothetical protein
MDLQDSGCQKRSQARKVALRDLEAALLGRRGLISERKVFAVAGGAAAGNAFPRSAEGAEHAFRVNRRKHKAFAGEEGDASDDDADSGNEGTKGRGGGGRGRGRGGGDADCALM